MAWDIKLFYAINNLAEKSQFWDQLFILANKYAVAVFTIILLVYFFRSRKVFWTAALSAILSRGILTEAIRFFYHRPRPFVALENVKRLIEKNGLEASFPSGHTAYIFAIALAVYLYDKKIGGILMAAVVLLTFARIYLGVHYPSDIIGGILIAYLSVLLVQKLLHRNK